MYKMIIVDDEIIIQEGLSNLVDWHELGFEIVGTFSDGEEVIEYLNAMPVDVILTDIRMTHLSGIDIAKYVYDSKLLCKVIFLSAHKEFDFAVQGIKYGVEDYIFKPTKVKEIKEVFSKLKKELDERNEDIEFRKKYEEQWHETYTILLENFLNDITMGTLDDRKFIQARMKVLFPDIDETKTMCALVTFEIKGYENFIKERWNYDIEQLDIALKNYVNLYVSKSYFHIVYKSQNFLKIFLIMKEVYLEEEKEALYQNELYKFQKSFSEIFGISLEICDERRYETIYELANRQHNYDISLEKSEKGSMQIFEQKKLVVSNIMLGNINAAQKVLENILYSLQREGIQYQKKILVDIVASINAFLEENNQALFQLIYPYTNYIDILNMKNEIDIMDYCNHIFELMKTKESLISYFDKDSLVNKVKEYIDENIYHDIVLENVANQLFLSTAHLSRLFKKQTGENFSQFVTKRKMQKAIELLHDPQYKVYQVADVLKYKTPRYFSKIFHNYTGYYPSQYRKEILNISGDIGDDE